MHRIIMLLILCLIVAVRTQIPFSKVNTSLFSNLTMPEFPPITLYSGTISGKWELGFLLATNRQDQSPNPLTNHPTLFWFEDLGQTSLVSLLLQSTDIKLLGNRNGESKYNIAINNQTLTDVFNIVYVDLPGVGLSSKETKLLQNFGEAVECLKGFIKTFLDKVGLKQEYYVGGRGIGAAIAVHYTTVYSVKGQLLINPHLSTKALLSTVGQHAQNHGLIDLQQRMKIESKLLAIRVLKDASQTVQQLLPIYQSIAPYIAECSGIDSYDYYNQFRQSILNSFTNEDSFREALGISGEFIVKSREPRLQFADLFGQSVSLLNPTIRTLILQGQTDIEYSPLTAMHWMNYITQLDNRPLVELDDNGVFKGLYKESGKTKYAVIWKSGRYMNESQVVRGMGQWLGTNQYALRH